MGRDMQELMDAVRLYSFASGRKTAAPTFFNVSRSVGDFAYAPECMLEDGDFAFPRLELLNDRGAKRFQMSVGQLTDDSLRFSRKKLGDVACIEPQEEQDEKAADIAAASCAAPTQHSVRRKRASWDQRLGAADSTRSVDPPAVGGRRHRDGGAGR
jgi:hypothetical protein